MPPGGHQKSGRPPGRLERVTSWKQAGLSLARLQSYPQHALTSVVTLLLLHPGCGFHWNLYLRRSFSGFSFLKARLLNAHASCPCFWSICASGFSSVKCPKVTELPMSSAHERLWGHQLVTHHQPASPQEKDNAKNVDHAGREHTIPGPEQHWLPYKQLGLPPGLGPGQAPLKTEHTKVSPGALGGPARGGGKCTRRRRANSALKCSHLVPTGQPCAQSRRLSLRKVSLLS